MGKSCNVLEYDGSSGLLFAYTVLTQQAMEQLRLCVTTMLSLTFRSGVNCNDPLAVDVLGYVTRLVSDKTG